MLWFCVLVVISLVVVSFLRWKERVVLGNDSLVVILSVRWLLWFVWISRWNMFRWVVWFSVVRVVVVVLCFMFLE